MNSPHPGLRAGAAPQLGPPPGQCACRARGHRRGRGDLRLLLRRSARDRAARRHVHPARAVLPGAVRRRARDRLRRRRHAPRRTLVGAPVGLGGDHRRPRRDRDDRRAARHELHAAAPADRGHRRRRPGRGRAARVQPAAHAAPPVKGAGRRAPAGPARSMSRRCRAADLRAAHRPARGSRQSAAPRPWPPPQAPRHGCGPDAPAADATPGPAREPPDSRCRATCPPAARAGAGGAPADRAERGDRPRSTAAPPTWPRRPAPDAGSGRSAAEAQPAPPTDRCRPLSASPRRRRRRHRRRQARAAGRASIRYAGSARSPRAARHAVARAGALPTPSRTARRGLLGRRGAGQFAGLVYPAREDGAGPR